VSKEAEEGDGHIGVSELSTSIFSPVCALIVIHSSIFLPVYRMPSELRHGDAETNSLIVNGNFSNDSRPDSSSKLLKVLFYKSIVNLLLKVNHFSNSIKLFRLCLNSFVVKEIKEKSMNA
jgi:hypothetical protein